MADKWDKYAVADDKWEQYAEDSKASKPSIKDALKAIPEIMTGRGRAKKSQEAAYKNVTSPMLSGVSSAAFGIPKFAMNKINPEMTKEVFPEQTDMFGKSLRFGSEAIGMAGGGAAKLGSAIAERALPKVVMNTAAGLPLGLGRESAALIQTGKKINDLRNIQRAAITGGVFGATQLNPDSTLGSQALQAGTGALLGGGIDRIGSLANSGMRNIRKFGYPAVRPLLTRISEVTKDANVSAKDKTDIINGQLNQYKTDTVNSIRKNIEDLNVSLQKSAETGSKRFQKDLPEFFKSNSKAYGNNLDAMSNELAKSGQKITKNDVINIVADSIKELDDVGIKNGSSRVYLEKLLNKYSNSKTEELSFKELIKHNKEIGDLLSSSTKKGTYGFSEQDIPVAIFQKNLGNYVSDLSPEFKALQDAYKPVIQAKIKAYQIFKPSRGDFYTKGGTDFIKRAANGKLEKGEKEFVDFLQSGSQLSGGVGDIVSPSINIGKNIMSAKQSIPNVISGVDKQKKAQEDFIKYQLSKRLEELTGRKRNVQDLLVERAKLHGARKTALDTVAGAGLVGAGYGGFRLVHDIGR